MERSRRIELLALAWKAKVLPLYELRIKLGGRYGSRTRDYGVTGHYYHRLTNRPTTSLLMITHLAI